LYTLKKQQEVTALSEKVEVVVLPTVSAAHTGLQTQACCLE